MRNIWGKKKSSQHTGNHVWLTIEDGVDEELNKILHHFVKTITEAYYFPKNLVIHIFNREQIKALNGNMVVGTCFYSYRKKATCHIRLAVGDFKQLVEERGKIDAIYVLLIDLAHEMTHYLFWIHYPKLSFLKAFDFINEGLAHCCARSIANAYMDLIYPSLYKREIKEIIR